MGYISWLFKILLQFLTNSKTITYVCATNIKVKTTGRMPFGLNGVSVRSPLYSPSWAQRRSPSHGNPWTFLKRYVKMLSDKSLAAYLSSASGNWRSLSDFGDLSSRRKRPSAGFVWHRLTRSE